MKVKILEAETDNFDIKRDCHREGEQWVYEYTVEVRTNKFKVSDLNGLITELIAIKNLLNIADNDLQKLTSGAKK